MAGSAIKLQLRRGALLASAGAMALPFAAHAQPEAAVDDASEETDDANPVIIVTAERREEQELLG